MGRENLSTVFQMLPTVRSVCAPDRLALRVFVSIVSTFRTCPIIHANMQKVNDLAPYFIKNFAK